MINKNEPANFSGIDSSDNPENWVNFMIDWSRLDSIILQRENILSKIKFNSSPKILIAGCGVGEVSQLFTNIPNAEVLGVDISKVMIDFARDEFSSKNVSFEQADLVDNLNLAEKYDLIWVERVLHHVPQANQALENLSKYLAPNGSLVVAEPYVPSTIISSMTTDEVFSFARKWSDSLANGEIAMDLPFMASELNLSPVFSFGSFVCINDYHRIHQFIDLSLFLSDSFTDKEKSIQQQKWQDDSDKGLFQLNWPMMNYIFHKK